MLTFGQLKSDIRARVFPSGEQDNLVASHDKIFVDAIVDLQTWVPCLQVDNTDTFPQCSTTYNCGLTVLPCPRGFVKKLSVIDKIDPTTGLESADAEDDWCSEIPYAEIEFCHIRNYLASSRRYGCCCAIGAWFNLPFWEYRPRIDLPSLRGYPVPTDAGVPTGLPALPLGFHYPQTSTDYAYGRAGAGVWAKDRGNIYVAPWIQSTETIIVKWDGIKRTWNVADPVDDDPLLAQAVEEYLRWKHAGIWDKDEGEAQRAENAYNIARQTMMKNCRDETRVRGCEPSVARGSSVTTSILYYNDAPQSFTASTCPDGTATTAKTVTIAAGTVASSVSVADANQKALAQAREEAEDQIDCTGHTTTPPTNVQYTITSSYGTGGVDTPAGTIVVTAGSSQTFTAAPNTDFDVSQWLVDGVVVQTGGESFTLSNIQANHTVQVTFVASTGSGGTGVTQYTLTVSAGMGGVVAPSGAYTVDAGATAVFAAAANANNSVKQWWLDGVVVQTGGASYSLTNVQANHTLQVTFEEIPVQTGPPYYNTVAGEYRASCTVYDENAPNPTGNDVYVYIPVGAVSDNGSIAAANAAAQLQAETQAKAGLVCTYHNSYQSYTKACPDGSNPVTGEVAANTYSYTVGPNANIPTDLQATQNQANAKAATDAYNRALSIFAAGSCNGVPNTPVFSSELQKGEARTIPINCGSEKFPVMLTFSVICWALPGFYTADSQLEANRVARLQAQAQANAMAVTRANSNLCGDYEFTI